MRSLEVAAIYAQASPIEHPATVIRAALLTVFVIVGTWVAVHIASKAHKQDTSRSLNIGVNVFIAAMVLVGAMVAVPVGIAVWTWLGFTPQA